MTKMLFNRGTSAFVVVIFYLFVFEIEGSPVIVERPDYLANCPRIVSRQEWKARNATSPYKQLNYKPAPYIVIHHGGMLNYCYEETGCADIVRSYQNMHIDERGWIDIGYNFVIGEDGNVYQGRGWDHVGAHSPGYNTQSIGISVIGDFSHFIPNSPALEALNLLIECGVELGKISDEYRIIGHRQARNTVCPGEVFYNWVQKMPGWTDRPIPVYQKSTTSLSSSSSNDTERAKIRGNTLEDANLPKDLSRLIDN